LLAAEPTVHSARSQLCSTRALTPVALERAYRALEREVTETLVGQGHSPSQVLLTRTIDVHYAGQSFELSLTMPSPADSAAIGSIDGRFAAEHERTYGHRADDDPVEVVHIRVQGKVPSQPVVRRTAQAQKTSESSRPAYFGAQRGLHQTAVLQRSSVGITGLSGPVIVEEYDATTVVPPGWSIRRDDRDNLLIERSQNA
jgi:N-methylhydantoinase A